MIGPDDAFLTTLVQLVRRLPVFFFPLFGRGKTRLQPVFVEDVAGTIVRLLENNGHVARVYEMGGPHIYSYRTLVEEIAAALSARRVLVSVPFSAWKLLAAVVERSSLNGLTVNQVELMEVDNVAALPDLTSLGINPTSVEECLKEILTASQPDRHIGFMIQRVGAPTSVPWLQWTHTAATSPSRRRIFQPQMRRRPTIDGRGAY